MSSVSRVAALCVALCSCVVSHPLGDDGGGVVDGGREIDAGVDSGGLADATPDAPAAMDGAVAPPGACTWSVGATTQLSDGPGVKLIGGLALADDGVLVAWTGYGFGPPEDTSLRVQRIDFDGTHTTSVTEPVPGSPLGAILSGEVAVSGAARAALAWDATRGCTFQPLAADDTPLGGAVPLTLRRCTVLSATGTGFSYLSAPSDGSPGCTYERVTADGTPIDSHPLSAGSVDARPGFATDGTFVLASQDDASLVHLQHFGSDGAALGADLVLPPEAGVLRGEPPVATSGGYLLVLDLYYTTAPGFGMAATPLDAEGSVTAAPTTLTDVVSSRGISYAVASSHGDVLVAWGDADRSGPTTIHAQPLSEPGAPRAAPLDLGTFGYDGRAPTIPFAITTPAGVLVVYVARRDPDPMPMQLFATLLVCDPR